MSGAGVLTEEYEVAFWGAGNVLYLVLGGSFLGIYAHM